LPILVIVYAVPTLRLSFLAVACGRGGIVAAGVAFIGQAIGVVIDSVFAGCIIQDVPLAIIPTLQVSLIGIGLVPATRILSVDEAVAIIILTIATSGHRALPLGSRYGAVLIL